MAPSFETGFEENLRVLVINNPASGEIRRGKIGSGGLIPGYSQRAAQAFQPVLTQAKACGYDVPPA
jgi:hypothetical protein